MLKTLIWKEVRELLPLVLLALLVQFYLVCTAIGMRLGPLSPEPIAIPFISDSFTYWLFIVAGVVAAILGLWQTWWESSRGTFQFLLHRPAKREAMFGAKLLVGVAVWLAIAVLPVLCYALWAAAPGTHASPFEWSMTAWAWLLCAKMPLVYLGAFLSGLRPARWFGSRFFPLAASLVVLAILQLAPWPLAALLACLALEASYVLVILHVAATRDYS